jgi:hypothetical protein
MRVLVIHPPVRVHREHIDYPLFSGLAAWHVSAALRAAGHRVRLVDAFALPSASITPKEPYAAVGADVKTVADAIKTEPFDAAVVHLSPFTVQEPEPESLWPIMAELRAAQPDAPVILADLHIGGMNYVAYESARFLQHPNRPDFLLRYEAELGLLDMLARIERGETAGLSRRQAIVGQPLKGPLSSHDGTLYSAADLDGFRAFMARALKNDSRPRPFALDADTLPFKSSRGCCFACSFCTSNPGARAGVKREWRPYAPEQLDMQVTALSALPWLKRLWVLDEAANVGAEHFDRLLGLFERHDLKAEFPNGLRADLLSDAQVERLAGRISLLSLSPESGSPEVLTKLISKRQSVSDVERVARRAQAVGLKAALHFIVGLPGERKSDIHATVSLAKRLFDETGAQPWLQFAVALPGTPLFELCRARGLLPDPPPRDYGPVFQGGPMLKDGACGLSNVELVALRDALERYTGRG